MFCPMMTHDSDNHRQCKMAGCAWWIGDEKEGSCAVKELATALDSIGDLTDYRELSRGLDKIQRRR